MIPNRHIKKIADCLLNGGVVVMPTDTVYGLAVSPNFPEAVEKLYKLKGRPRSQPLPIMVAKKEQLLPLGLDVNKAATNIVNSEYVPGAVTLILGFQDTPKVDWLIGREEVGVRIPNDERMLKVLEKTGPLLVTSANRHSEKAIPQNVDEILAQLDGSPELAIHGETPGAAPSTIINCRTNPPKIERAGAIPEAILFEIINKATPTEGTLVLGIESSCDDTAVAIVDEKGNVLSSVIKSQVAIHQEFGGVFPEFAGRAHVVSILPTVEKALEEAKVTQKDIRAIGVTRGPGLIGSLLVGLNTANGLGLGWDIPVIGVNHLRGHLRSADLDEKRVKYPAVILLVSGGHTFLAYMKDQNSIELLGSTRDDSVGEAYDKVSRMLGWGYPGGPVVDRNAKKGQPNIPFPRPMLHKGLEFSFSGLKSAVARYMANPENDINKEDIAASFVASVMEVLVKKCRRALDEYPAVSLVVVGGVAASPQLRAETRALCDERGVELCLPPLKWATDNAAMIALATWDYIHQDKMISAAPQLQLPITEY
ncbi:MAG: tRNA (adenosine(37)-N6)-threonylcarbamoyltransferase complex transferase subunit TsaD [Bacteroidota bacterium]